MGQAEDEGTVRVQVQKAYRSIHWVAGSRWAGSCSMQDRGYGIPKPCRCDEEGKKPHATGRSIHVSLQAHDVRRRRRSIGTSWACKAGATWQFPRPRAGYLPGDPDRLALFSANGREGAIPACTLIAPGRERFRRAQRHDPQPLDRRGQLCDPRRRPGGGQGGPGCAAPPGCRSPGGTGEFRHTGGLQAIFISPIRRGKSGVEG